MTVTTTWTINTLVRVTADGYVHKVIYRVDATDGTYKAGAAGEIDLPKPETLIPYKDLTKDQVIGWVKATIEAQAATGSVPSVAQIEAALSGQIEEQKSPSTAVSVPYSSVGVPWS